MSKLPTIPVPVFPRFPEVQRAVEKALAPLTGKKLEQAQEAVIKLYQSGQQMGQEQWIAQCTDAIASVAGPREAVT